MPLPSRRRGEKKSTFVSRCISFMSKNNEGKSQSQRVAICNSRAAITDDEMNAIANLWSRSREIKNLTPPMKKKRKDSDRISIEDGSETDTSVAKKDKDKTPKKLKKIKDSPY